MPRRVRSPRGMGSEAVVCREMPGLFAKAKMVKARLGMKKEEVGNRV